MPSVIELADLPDLPKIEDPARLMAMAHRGQALDDVIDDRAARLTRNPSDTAAMMDLALVLQFYGRRDEALAFQRQALARARLFADTAPAEQGIRVLLFTAPGDLAVNMPIELLLRAGSARLVRLYLRADGALPTRVPDHDLAVVAVSEFDATRDILDRLAGIAARWPRPVLNDPARIRALARDTLPDLLRGIPGLHVPETWRMKRDEIPRRAAASDVPGGAFPLICRPIDSHGGKGLARLANPGALAAHVAAIDAEHFFVAPLVDYRSTDGLYRKFRIALIDGEPHLCHLAISDRWMVSYMGAGMDRDGAKRDEEARAMREFGHGFGARHGGALRALAERIGLDYVVLDCAETRTGELLLFEADNAAAVHDLDPPELFPYKGPHMARVFDAFAALLGKVAARPPRRNS